jgi:Na+/H+-dicarboxylate symporter
MLVPENLFVAAAEMQLLPIITFAILFGAVLTSMASQVVTLTAVVEQANAALMRFVLALMRVAPLGIFCLVAARFGKAVAEQRLGEELSQIGGYFLTVLLGLALHSLIVLPLIYWWKIRKNPFAFLGQMSKALMTAFSTASSSATVPITLECAEHSGISKQSREFVIPLGSTVNMDGTALYEAVAAIFIAQAIGFDLTPFNQVVIAVTATLASIGAAGIPEAGLVTMLIVLNAVGLPVEYIGLILSIDWLVDRFRTTVNVWGDCVGAAVVDNTLR